MYLRQKSIIVFLFLSAVFFSCNNKDLIRISGKKLAHLDKSDYIKSFRRTNLDGAEIKFNDTLTVVDLPVGMFRFPDDWSAFRRFRIDIYNPLNHNIKLFSGIYGLNYILGDTILLEPHVSVLQDIDLSELPLITKQDDKLVPAGIRLSVENKHEVQSLVITGMNLEREIVDFRMPVIDRFGQRVKGSWKGKVRHARDLETNLDVEHKYLETLNDTINTDRFGGFLTGTKFFGRGYFYTYKTEDLWRLISPEGNIFWSCGVTGFLPDDSKTQGTIIKGREYLFNEKNEQPSGIVNFYLSNVLSKYGSINDWMEFQQFRFAKWGINTVYGTNNDTLLSHSGIPYIRILELANDARFQIADSLCDFFDPEWQNFADSVLSGIAGFQSDSFLMGYITDRGLKLKDMNLMRWLPDSCPARIEWQDLLKRKFGWSLKNLNTVLKTDFESWEEIRDLKNLSGETLMPYYSEFEYLFIEEYYRTISSLLNKYDNRHLNLGCILAEAGTDARTFETAGKYCDMLTIKTKSDSIDPVQLNRIYHLAEKPIIIQRRNIPTLSPRYLLPTNAAEPVDKNSALLFSNLKKATSLPFCVGFAAIQFVDQPISGNCRNDGNLAIGLVDITDQPYFEIVDALIRANQYIRSHKP